MAKGKPWKKGESGNPSGRPKSTFNYLKELDAKLSEVHPTDPQGRTHGQIIVAKQVELAEQGSIRALNEMNDRRMGKPVQSTNISGSLNVQNPEEHVASILEALAVLSPDAKPNEPGDPRIN